jgi:hypothetical protein
MLNWNQSQSHTPGRVGRVVLDIETALCSEGALDFERSLLKPAGNVKDKEGNLKKKRAALPGKNGTLDSNPIALIGTMFGQSICLFTWIPLQTTELDSLNSQGVKVFQEQNERSMFCLFSQAVERLTDEATKVITFNEGFDLSKIRNVFAVNDLPIPVILKNHWQHVDLMKKFAGFTVNKDLKKFVKLEIACKLLRVPVYLPVGLDGGESPKAIADGRGYEVIVKNICDLLMTSQLADKMGV